MIRFQKFLSEALTKEKFDSEMSKLNSAQKKTVRKLFSGRVPTVLYVDGAISKVTVEFGPVIHYVILGPKGKIISHETASKR
jgi:hypothetical protein